MNEQEIYHVLKEKFPHELAAFVAEGAMPFAVVDPSGLTDVMRVLKSDPDLSFDYLSSISGVDREDKMEVVYHLFSYVKKHRFVLKVYLDRDNPEVDTVTGIWSGANWHEREAYDMLGIRFREHPDLRRILMVEDWEGHPLRKDYKFPDEYHGISNR